MNGLLKNKSWMAIILITPMLILHSGSGPLLCPLHIVIHETHKISWNFIIIDILQMKKPTHRIGKELFNKLLIFRCGQGSVRNHGIKIIEHSIKWRGKSH